MKPLTGVAMADESGHLPAYLINSHLENCRARILLIAFRQIWTILTKDLNVAVTFAREHLWRR